MRRCPPPRRRAGREPPRPDERGGGVQDVVRAGHGGPHLGRPAPTARVKRLPTPRRGRRGSRRRPRRGRAPRPVRRAGRGAASVRRRMRRRPRSPASRSTPPRGPPPAHLAAIAAAPGSSAQTELRARAAEAQKASAYDSWVGNDRRGRARRSSRSRPRASARTMRSYSSASMMRTSLAPAWAFAPRSRRTAPQTSDASIPAARSALRPSRWWSSSRARPGDREDALPPREVRPRLVPPARRACPPRAPPRPRRCPRRTRLERRTT